MSKKNSSVILKERLINNDELSLIYFNFKRKVIKLEKKNFLVAVSGGPDSLALAALAKLYSIENKIKIYFVLINHNLRKNSSQEAKNVKKLLKKFQINLTILLNKKKVINTSSIGLSNLNERYKILTGKEINIEKRNEHFVVELPLL